MANLVSYTQSPFNKARKDKFLFVLNLPQCLKDISKKFNRSNETVLPDSLQFSVYGAVVPEVAVPSVNIRYSGQTLSNSSHSRDPYPPVTINFTVDNRFNNYWIIYKWLDLLNNATESIYDAENLTKISAYAENLTNINSNIAANQVKRSLSVENRTNAAGADYLRFRSNFTLFALDEYDKRVIEFVYKDAFPTAIGSINFNNRDSTELETNFTFEYSQLLVSLVEQIDNF